MPAKRLDDLPEVLEALDRRIAEHQKGCLRRAQTATTAVPERAKGLLAGAVSEPYTPVSRLWQGIGAISASAQKAAHRQLERGGLARFEEIRIGRANVLLIDVLDRGYELLGKPPPRRRGRGSIAHRHFAQWIAMVGARRGHDKRAVEWLIPGTTHPVDAAWHVDGDWHVFEVVVGCADNILSHIEACFRQPTVVATLTIVVSQVAKRKALETEIRGAMLLSPSLAQIRFEVIDSYLRELWP